MMIWVSGLRIAVASYLFLCITSFLNERANISKFVSEKERILFVLAHPDDEVMFMVIAKGELHTLASHIAILSFQILHILSLYDKW